MKKFLEVLMDENGELHFSTDLVFADDVVNPPKDMEKYAEEALQMHKTAIRSLIDTLWREKNYNVSKAIRYLSMAEINATREPYESAETFWFAMMFDYLPYFENYSNRLKKPYGFNPRKMTRPITFDGRNTRDPLGFETSIFPLKNLKWN